MILAEQIYMLVRNELESLNIRAYSDYIPDGCKYPFVMYEILSIELDPDLAFNTDYERLTVRFNAYDKSNNPSKLIEILEKIETNLNRTKKSFIDTTEGKYLVCNHKVNDNISYLDADYFWSAYSDYEFIAQRNI